MPDADFGDATATMDERATRTGHRTPDRTPAAAALSATAAAAALGVDERTIRRAIARGDLPATKRAGVYRIAPADLARYRARRRSAPPATRTRPEPARRLIRSPTGDDESRPLSRARSRR